MEGWGGWWKRAGRWLILLFLLLISVQYLVGSTVSQATVAHPALARLATLFLLSTTPLPTPPLNLSSPVPLPADYPLPTNVSSPTGISTASVLHVATSPMPATTSSPWIFKGQPEDLPDCPVIPPVLVGRIKVWFDYPKWEELEKLYPFLEKGGHGKPKDCKSRHRVAIVIPYRDRDSHLRAFLHNLHSLLTKQQLDYAIFVVEQVANQTFNRGKLMNVGFVEAKKVYNWQCVIFHDVDLFPEDDRNIYSCPEQPRHMSVAVDKFNYKLPYVDIFGGITALRVEHFASVNGMSNDFWGWGGEDDDFATRVKSNSFRIQRYPADIARYKMIKHQTEKSNPVNKCRFTLIYATKRRYKNDGLNTLSYELKSRDFYPLYTRLLVDLHETEGREQLAKEAICKN